MKVADVMEKHVEFVTKDTPISEVARLIFGRKINGVPICNDRRERKVVGFVTERDILSKFYPSLQEFIEDPVHSQDFEEMEKKINEILSLPTKKIMSARPTTVTAKTPVLRAQSLMLVRKIGRLPVVDEEGRLIGIIAKGDIFKAVVGMKLALGEEEGFYDWLGRHYDTLVDWKVRLPIEILDLNRIFKKEKVRSVLDVASSTGEHTVALAKEGYDAYGFETSGLMHQIAEEKKAKLSKQIAERVHLFNGTYSEISDRFPNTIDAAIFMGNTLPHVMHTDQNILEDVEKVMKTNKALMVFQTVNFHKIFEINGGLRGFAIRKVDGTLEKEYAYLAFFTKGKGKRVMYNLAIFDRMGDNWGFRGINCTSIVYIDEKELISRLKKLGFTNISTYGSAFYSHMFTRPFDLEESDWVNIIAKR